MRSKLNFKTMAFVTSKDMLNKYRPTLTMDGNQYCLLAGQDLQVGFAGFGSTLKECFTDFVFKAIENENRNEYDTEIDDETMD
ncbi:MAG: hypothetical protein NTZ59_11520 [Bacteroidetes bacterium]|nr:hypothetical protein [Bacteroidota bacterium]